MPDITEQLSHTPEDTFFRIQSSHKTAYIKGSKWPVDGPRIVPKHLEIPLTQVTSVTYAEYAAYVINSISWKYKKLRQDSKGPTFALTYQGTWHTLVNNLGFAPETAKSIEKNYHELYKESDKWIQQKLKKASKTGYVEAAFGLRVRTPKLGQTIYGNKMPYEAQAEARTAGNALGQSWGLLNNRAQNEFLALVRNSPHKEEIHPIASIHDSLYFLVQRKPETVKYVNDYLIKCMEWNDHPTIYHPTVGLGASLEIFYPTWADSTSLPNYASLDEITEILNSLT